MRVRIPNNAINPLAEAYRGLREGVRGIDRTEPSRKKHTAGRGSASNG